MSSSASIASTSWGSRSCRPTASRGWRCDSSRTARSTGPVSMLAKPATRTSPTGSASRSSVPRAAWMLARIWRAEGSSAVPAGVRRSRRPTRSASGTPMARCSAASCCDTADLLYPLASATAPRVPRSSSSTSTRIHCRSTAALSTISERCVQNPAMDVDDMLWLHGWHDERSSFPVASLPPAGGRWARPVPGAGADLDDVGAARRGPLDQAVRLVEGGGDDLAAPVLRRRDDAPGRAPANWQAGPARPRRRRGARGDDRRDDPGVLRCGQPAAARHRRGGRVPRPARRGGGARQPPAGPGVGGDGAGRRDVPHPALVAAPLGAPQALPHLTLGGALACAGLAVLGPALPYAAEMTALRVLAPAVFGVWMSLEPAIGTAVGLLVLHQVPEAVQLLGVLLVVAASVGAVLTGPPDRLVTASDATITKPVADSTEERSILGPRTEVRS